MTSPFHTTTPNFDSLQSMMTRLQLRSPYLNTNSFLTQTLDDLLLDTEDSDTNSFDSLSFLSLPDDPALSSTQLAKEEAKLEKEIVKVILSKSTDSLKPNSGQAVTVGEHHICVGFHQEEEDEYRVWEWHGHIMLYDEENGFSPEYIYGNYFERLAKSGSTRLRGRARRGVVEEEKVLVEEKEEVEEEESRGLGLRELIGGGELSSGRIVHRSLNARAQRY